MSMEREAEDNLTNCTKLLGGGFRQPELHEAQRESSAVRQGSCVGESETNGYKKKGRTQREVAGRGAVEADENGSIQKC